MQEVVMPFDGKAIETVTGEDGKPWISVRSVCEAIGIAGVQDQIEKIRRHAGMMSKAILVHDSLGRRQKSP